MGRKRMRMKNKKYTIGEILRGGLLLNHKGEPYNNRGTISRVLQKVPHEKVVTAYGVAKLFSLADINRSNKGRLKWYTPEQVFGKKKK
jgi:hypothetical protein